MFRRSTTAVVAALLLSPQFAFAGGAATTRWSTNLVAGSATHDATSLSRQTPQRVIIPEPPRGSPLPHAKPFVVPAVKPNHAFKPAGVTLRGPRILDGDALRAFLSEGRSDRAARRAGSHSTGVPAITSDAAPRSGVSKRNAAAGRSTGGAPTGPRRAISSLNDGTSGTGINPWWRYSEEDVPGAGHVMVNVGTGNLLIQADDLNVSYKGVSLAFRRTYNSQSLHDVNADDAPVSTSFGTGANPAIFGNRWTNTFDAHMTWDPSSNILTVYDIDGAAYKYVLNAAQTGWVSATAGQYATLAFDGSCGYLWTKKSGTIYYFWHPDVGNRCGAQNAAYGGRLYEIVGRNNYLAIRLTYSWDTGAATAGAKVSSIVAAAIDSAGTQKSATLAFGDVAGHRVLQSLTRPDGSTILYFYYDNGDLWFVDGVPNNSGTGPRWEGYASAVSPGGVPYMPYAVGPRWLGSNGTDGGYLAFGYQLGASVATTNLTQIDHIGYANPTISDGTNSGAIQPLMPPGLSTFASEFYTLGSGAATLRDTDGHSTNWVIDGAGRPTQTQECTNATSTQCTGAWLTSNETWDAANNLVSEVDPRGDETDYLYDPMGNTTAVGEPYTTTSQGSFRPTKLYDYDAYNNVVAYCDEKASHANGGRGDWRSAGPPSAGGPDALCATNGSSAHAVFTYLTYPAQTYEPYGELTAIRSPLGYTRTIGYDASKQGGMDYGLPTSVQGSTIAQTDGSRTPLQTMAYDASGNLICSLTDGNDRTTTTLLVYDALNRVVAVADPDDASVTNGCAKTPGIAGSAIVTRTTYFPNGQVATTTTPAEAAANVSTQFQYDLDGDVISEQRHFVAGAGPIQKWYDGADRLVEVQQPTDANDFYTFPMENALSLRLDSGRNGHDRIERTVSCIRRPVQDAGATAERRDHAAMERAGFGLRCLYRHLEPHVAGHGRHGLRCAGPRGDGVSQYRRRSDAGDEHLRRSRQRRPSVAEVQREQ
jgi:YD repeat-containing protein